MAAVAAKSAAFDAYIFTFTPRAAISRSVSWAISSYFKSVKAMSAPSRANAIATAFPMPREAPVTMAVFPSNNLIVYLLVKNEYTTGLSPPPTFPPASSAKIRKIRTNPRVIPPRRPEKTTPPAILRPKTAPSAENPPPRLAPSPEIATFDTEDCGETDNYTPPSGGCVKIVIHTPPAALPPPPLP